MNNELLEYFKGDELAASVWQSKYKKDGDVTPEDMHRRLAKEFARIESKHINNEMLSVNLSTYGQSRTNLTEEKLFSLFDRFKTVIPQGSVMANLGSKEITSLSNCFVIGTPEDSYGGILKKDEELVQLMKRRGGVGIDISTLRPASAPVTNSAKTSTGAVSFMHRFSNSTREVAQGGRRGALMVSIDIRHPDVMEFIKIKRDKTSVTGANISIKLNDDFMKAVENNEDYILHWPIDIVPTEKEWSEALEYDQLHVFKMGDHSIYAKKIKAKEYWNEIITSAKDYAEPGLMFWDKMVEYSPDGVYPEFRQVTTNPCSEIAMQPYDACRLIAVNLFGFVKHPFTSDAYFDYDNFYKVNYEAMRISDDLVDLEIESIEKILDKINSDPESEDSKRVEKELWTKVRDTAKDSRRTGLGLTGLGDTLAALDVKYDSDEAFMIIENIMNYKMESELDCTIDLSILRGVFPRYNSDLEYTNGEGNNEWYTFLNINYPEQADRMRKYGRRNLSFSTIAPTGSVSLIAQVTSGLEPLFQPYYIRRKKVNSSEDRVDFIDEVGDKWTEYGVLHPKFKDWIRINYLLPSEELEKFSKSELDELFKESPWFGSTANDIDWIKRVETQSILQAYITHSISSTINLPSTVTHKEVSNIYLESWKKGLKGVTVYVDGSRSGVLVTESNKSKVFSERPESIPCKVLRFKNDKKNWIAFIGLMNDKPYEVFTGINDLDEFPVPSNVTEGEIIKIAKDGERSRYDFKYVDKYGYSNTLGGLNRVFNKEYWNYARLTSSQLRRNIPLIDVINDISKLEFSNRSLNSWQAGMIRSLNLFVADGTETKEPCTECGKKELIYENGCTVCRNCGHSACG